MSSAIDATNTKRGKGKKSPAGAALAVQASKVVERIFQLSLSRNFDCPLYFRSCLSSDRGTHDSRRGSPRRRKSLLQPLKQTMGPGKLTGRRKISLRQSVSSSDAASWLAASLEGKGGSPVGKHRQGVFLACYNCPPFAGMSASVPGPSPSVPASRGGATLRPHRNSPAGAISTIGDESLPERVRAGPLGELRIRRC